MVQLKEPLLLLVAIITLNSMCNIDKEFNCSTISISNAKKKIEFNKEEFRLIGNQSGYELTILNTEKLDTIIDIENPEIRFCGNGKQITAIGNPLFTSSIPKGAECFFGLSNKNKISFSMGNKILLTVVKKVIKKE